MAQRSTVALALVLVACGHTEPFTPPDHSTDQPFDGTPPIRLTRNFLADRHPTWLADGSGIVYSVNLPERPDRDLCLALLPPTGGRRREVWCDVLGDGNTTDGIEYPVFAPDDRVFFLASTTPVGGVSPLSWGLALAPATNPRDGAMLRPLPYTPDGGSQQNGAGQFRWLDANRVVFLGERVQYFTPCRFCDLDTVETGLSVNLFDVQSRSIPAAVPGTEFASGVAPAPGGDAILFTLAGDTRVYRRTLSTGEVTVAHDFGEIARDLHAVGTRLVAIVGGRVAFNTHPLLGPVQWDTGGVIHVLDLDSGTDHPLVDPSHLYRRPALSPAADRIVAEGFEVTVGGAPPDTVIQIDSDLFLLGAP